jgi:hypothetical protein
MKTVFELIKTFEFDIESDNEELENESLEFKIELLQNLEDPEHFRFRIYETELFRMHPSFPRDEKEQPLHVTTEILWTERTLAGLRYKKQEFRAKEVSEAVDIILSEIDSVYRHLLMIPAE